MSACIPTRSKVAPPVMRGSRGGPVREKGTNIPSCPGAKTRNTTKTNVTIRKRWHEDRSVDDRTKQRTVIVTVWHRTSDEVRQAPQLS